MSRLAKRYTAAVPVAQYPPINHALYSRQQTLTNLFERVGDAMPQVGVASAVGAAGAMPICVGVTHAGTRATVDLAQMAQDLGAHSVMVTPTKEAFPQSDAQLFDYFAAVQDGCALPIVLQDHPASTGVFMGAELLVQICAHLASVQCIKLEAVPTSA